MSHLPPDPEDLRTVGHQVEVAGEKVEAAGKKVSVSSTQISIAVFSIIVTALTSVVNAYINKTNGSATQEKLGTIHSIVNSTYTASIKRELKLLEHIAEEQADRARAYPQDAVAKQAAIRWRAEAEETRRILADLEAAPPSRPGLFPAPAPGPR